MNVLKEVFGVAYIVTLFYKGKAYYLARKGKTTDGTPIYRQVEDKLKAEWFSSEEEALEVARSYCESVEIYNRVSITHCLLTENSTTIYIPKKKIVLEKET